VKGIQGQFYLTELGLNFAELIPEVYKTEANRLNAKLRWTDL